LKIILDEGVPEGLSAYLSAHDVHSVGSLGWKSTKNGKLLAAIEARGFEALISNDKRLEFDQNLSRRPFRVLLLSTNHWPTIQPNAGRIATALETAAPATVTKVNCGVFVPRRFRQTSP
jgi:hypothetical protein